MRLRSFFLALAIAAIFAGSAMAAAPPGAIMNTINGVGAAINSDNATKVGAYFASSATVLDEFPPFIWSGTGAGTSWWRSVQAANAKTHWSHLHASIGTITQYTIFGNAAYVVVPVSLSWVMGKRARHENGLWSLTLVHSAGAWKITSAGWARL
jgi:hypothetical protein